MTVKIDNLAEHTIAGWSDGWRPIAAAPKNLPILVFFDDGEMEVARWTISDTGEDLGWWTNDNLDFNYGQDSPTYWMPLPAPPRSNA